MEQQRDFKGVWIDRKIWLDKDLNINEKFYLALYIQFDKNKALADYFFTKTMSLSLLNKVKKSLHKRGFIPPIETPEDAKQYVLKNKNTGIVCSWCGCKTSAIQKHHFPIAKKKGGTKTVDICPNCHYEYHKIIGENCCYDKI